MGFGSLIRPVHIRQERRSALMTSDAQRWARQRACAPTPRPTGGYRWRLRAGWRRGRCRFARRVVLCARRDESAVRSAQRHLPGDAGGRPRRAAASRRVLSSRREHSRPNPRREDRRRGLRSGLLAAPLRSRLSIPCLDLSGQTFTSVTVSALALPRAAHWSRVADDLGALGAHPHELRGPKRGGRGRPAA
jgi:hypothetical protein